MKCRKWRYSCWLWYIEWWRMLTVMQTVFTAEAWEEPDAVCVVSFHYSICALTARRELLIRQRTICVICFKAFSIPFLFYLNWTPQKRFLHPVPAKCGDHWDPRKRVRVSSITIQWWDSWQFLKERVVSVTVEVLLNIKHQPIYTNHMLSALSTLFNIHFKHGAKHLNKLLLRDFNNQYLISLFAYVVFELKLYILHQLADMWSLLCGCAGVNSILVT